MTTASLPGPADRIDQGQRGGAVPQPPAGVVPSERILQGQRSVAIEHNGSVYRLQATRQGKLILTK